MSASLTIRVNSVGRTKPLLSDWSIPAPPDLREGGEPITVRRLVEHVVRAEVSAFRERQADRRFIHALTARDIQAAVERGKVDMGGHDLQQEVDEEQAVGAAWQAFDDGLYLVLVDDRQQRELDREVFVGPDSRVTFLRLTLLAGG